MLSTIRTIEEITAELDQFYAENPSLVRIAPKLLRTIEAMGGTFCFVTGRVHIPPVDTTKPIRHLRAAAKPRREVAYS